MPNEVRILIRTQNSAKAGFEQVEKDADGFAKKTADTWSKRFTDTITANLREGVTRNLQQVGQQAEASARMAGERIGDTIGRHAGDTINKRINERLRDSRGRFLPNGAGSGGIDRDRDKVHVDVDVDKQSLLSRFASWGREASSRFGDAFKTGFASVFSGDVISTVIKGALVAAGVTVLAPVLGGVIVSGILLALGGGAIAAGVAGALKDPRIQIATKGIADKMKEMFKGFSDNFRGPIENFLAPGNGGGGGLIGLLDRISPQLEHLGTVLGPVADKLGDGLIGMLQNLLPSILRAVEGATPLIEELAESLPQMGKDLGRFFDYIAAAGPDAAVFFNDLLAGVGLLIRFIGFLLNAFVRMYTAGRTAVLSLAGVFVAGFEMMLISAEIAFGWIPGLGPKLTRAREQFTSWSKSIRNQLKSIPDEKSFTLRFRIVGLAVAQAAISTARILKGMGMGRAHGGISGQAASGGLMNGLTWVGEQGPELVDLPAGSRVHSAGDSQRMAGQGGGGGGQLAVRVIADRTTERGLMDVLMGALRMEIRDNFGGDTQLALGS